MSNLEQGIAAYDASKFTEALRILLPLAEKRLMEAQKIVATIYDFGYGVPVNTDEAIKWYRLASKQGDPVAQNNLASLLLVSDPDKAIIWYVTAAEQNFPFAQEILGDIYSGQLSLPTNMEEKYKDLDCCDLRERSLSKHQAATSMGCLANKWEKTSVAD